MSTQKFHKLCFLLYPRRALYSLASLAESNQVFRFGAFLTIVGKFEKKPKFYERG